MKSMFIPYISEYEITGIINSLKNISTGCDYIPASIAKQCIQHYIKPPAYLINSSFECGIFPNELKFSKIGINKIYQIIGQYQYNLSFIKSLRQLCITI